MMVDNRYMTKRRLVSVHYINEYPYWGKNCQMGLLTKWVSAAQLRLLGVFRSKFIVNAVQQLDEALPRVLLQRGDKGP
jgi:hypothetical protein